MKAFTTAISICVLLVSTAWSESPEQHLKQQLKGKTVLIRGFFQDERLEYTAQGEVMGDPKPGAWTLAKMQIEEIRVRNDTFELRGTRVAMVMDYKRGEFINVLPAHKDSIKITVHAPAATTDAQKLDNLIQKIFVIEPKPQASLFPPYWQDFFTGRITKIQGKEGRFIFKRDNSDFENKTNEGAPLNLMTPPGTPARPMPKNTQPPKIVRQVPPDYSELARASGISGTVLVGIEVDKSGEPRNPQIVAPVGFGLDDKAIEAVQQWRFVPAKLNGEPVSVLLDVEISFRIY